MLSRITKLFSTLSLWWAFPCQTGLCGEDSQIKSPQKVLKRTSPIMGIRSMSWCQTPELRGDQDHPQNPLWLKPKKEM